MKQTILAAVFFFGISLLHGAEMLVLHTVVNPTNPSVHWVYELPRSECARQPQWNPATQELPLSIRQLCEIALTNTIPPDFPDAKSWKVDWINFRPFPATWSGSNYPVDLSNRWACVITLVAYGSYTGQDWWNRRKEAIVLLDGTLLHPIKKSVFPQKTMTQTVTDTTMVILIPLFLIGTACWFLLRKRMKATEVA